jgi:hypothetical protein
MAKKKPKAKGRSTAAAAKPKKAATTRKTAVAADWRAKLLAEVRRLIHDADPDITEERKWVKPTNPAGVPVWSNGGILCTGETYKDYVKLTFFQGASLKDPKGLFNAGFGGGTRRAIDLREDEKLDAKALKALIQAAVAHNLKSSTPKSKSLPKAKPVARATKRVKLLSGGNPQVSKGEGVGPVQDYIAAMPGWKKAVGKRVDELILRTVPNVQKAVKWNSPFYGVEGQGWFLAFHVFTRYVKINFFKGQSLRPIPPGPSRDKNVRYLDIYEKDQLNEAQFTSWVKQAAAIPGWMS